MADENRGAGIPGNASPAVILWMIVLGAYSTINGMMTITQWSAYSSWTQLYYTLCMAAPMEIPRHPILAGSTSGRLTR